MQDLNSTGIADFSLESLEALNQALTQAEQHLHSIRDFIRLGVTLLRQFDAHLGQGTEDFFAESAALVLQTLSLDWSADSEILDARLLPLEKQQFLALLRRRIAERIPTSYLLNLAYFCDLPFYVDERVLIPRSPIAELIRQQFFPYFEPDDAAQPLNGVTDGEPQFFEHGLAARYHLPPQRILDLCTGSGCIAIALATRFIDAEVDAADIDKDALEVAAVNVDHHALGHRVNLIESNLFEKIVPEQQYDLIVTNPPYVDAATMADLPAEFLHEPEHALAAGQDGLDLVHRILYHAPDYLNENGLLVCEVGASEWALQQAYPQIDFHWLTFAGGGSGVFALEYAELVAHRAAFAQHVSQ